jgi:Na+-transporting methylmalonyl-CoA/oxaloacetate decarboxylase gamma subunit
VFVLVLLGAVLARALSLWILGGAGVVLLFLLFFAVLMAFTGRRESPRPPSPH